MYLNASRILICWCLFFSSTTLNAQILVEGNYDKLVPAGKEVDAIYGDYALTSQFAKAVVAKPVRNRKANMTVGNVGGCLLDLTHCEFESDQLSAFYPGSRAFTFSDMKGDDGSLMVTSKGTSSKPECAVKYRLDSSLPIVHVMTTFKNTTNDEWQVVLQDEIRLDGQKEEIRKTKATKDAELYYINDTYWQQAYGFRAPGYTISSSSDQRLSKLTYKPITGALPRLKPDESFTFERQILVHRDLAGVHAIASLADGKQIADCKLTIQDKTGQPINNASVTIRKQNQLHGILKSNEAGEVSLKLEDGQYAASVSVAGNRELRDKKLSVSADQRNFVLVCDDYTPGRLELRITDSNGNAIPAKVEFQGQNKTPSPYWGPDSAEFFVRNLAYTPNGSVDVELDAGDYKLIISRGCEYDAQFETITITPNETNSLVATLKQSVNSAGWISTDFHSHSSPSGDNTGSQLGRVLNLAAEHIEFAPCTEHNRIDTYSDDIASLGLAPFLATETGMELTGQPLPLNHQNVFPMKMVPRTQDNGAPQTDADPEQQIERLTLWDDRSEKLIQQNHPDIGWLFFDKNGDGKPDGGYSRSFRLMDVMEIHPIDPILQLGPHQLKDGKPNGNLPIFNWLQLLNQGHRIFGVVNTDAHYNYHGSGWLRNWVQSPTDDPSKIDPMDVVMASQQGRIIMSNGPFLKAEFSAAGEEEVYVSGQSMNSTTGKVSVKIQVQCPNWFDVDRVFVLVNGRKMSKYSFERGKNPEMFSNGVVKFDQTIDIELKEDSHLIVVTGDLSKKLGEVFGPSGGNQYPAALTNPVFVQIGDSPSFKVNKDTLDHPLPVKFSNVP